MNVDEPRRPRSVRDRLIARAVLFSRRNDRDALQDVLLAPYDDTAWTALRYEARRRLAKLAAAEYREATEQTPLDDDATGETTQP